MTRRQEIVGLADANKKIVGPSDHRSDIVGTLDGRRNKSNLREF